MDAWTQAGLLALIAAATATDLIYRRIPNVITVTGALVGLFLAMRSGGPQALLVALAGLGVALLILGPLYLLKLFGAGDVKLAAAIGTFVGPHEIISVLLATAIAGGFIAAAIALDRGLIRHLLGNLRTLASGAWHGIAPHLMEPTTSVSAMPYGPCLAIGSLWWLFTHHPP
jgi:prepilin peptidase CpaA